MKIFSVISTVLCAFMLLASPAMAADTAPTQADPDHTAQGINIGVYGDSLGDGVWSGLYGMTKKHPTNKLFRHAKVGAGLTRGDFANWMTEFSTSLDTDHITTAVVMVGANDQQSIRDETRKGFLFKSEGWKRVYNAHIEAMYAEFKKRNINVIWLGLPVMRDADLNAGSAFLNDLFAAQAKSHEATFIAVVDTFKSTDGTFTSHLPDASGKLRAVRLEDGIHFTGYGYELLAEKVYAAIPPMKQAAVAAVVR